jgi:uncharacterized repeat protein (TIGR01451 family)
MKLILFTTTLFFLFISSVVYSQKIGSSKCYGSLSLSGVGVDGDDAMGIIRTQDNGYAFASSVNDSGGDIPSNRGISDFWIVKTDSNGIVQWKKSIGGTDVDISYSLAETADSSIYVVGYTFSNDFDMACNIGTINTLIFKLSSTGNILNSRCFGGIWGGGERPHITNTPDNGVIVTSTNNTNDGDISGNHGGEDIWIAKFDSSLNIQWQRCYGGSSVESSNDIINGLNGDFIMTGRARSVNGDLTFNRGIFDLWILRIDSIGNIIWNQLIAGSDSDIPYSVYLDTDSNIYVCGYTSSNDFDFIGNHGKSDAIVIKLNYSGNIIWKKCYGGSSQDQSNSIIKDVDGNFLISGYTYSNDFDVAGNNGTNGSGWIFKIDSSGTLIWQKCYKDIWPNEFVRDNKSIRHFIHNAFPQGCSNGNVAVSELKPTNFLIGKVYVDYNSNQQIDVGEPLYQNAFVLTASNNDSLSTFSNTDGNFWLYPDSGTYITSLPHSVPYYNYLPLQHITSNSTRGNFDTINFALTPIPGIHDLQITLIPATQAFIGGYATYRLHFKNAGTDSTSAVIYFNIDSVLDFISANPSPSGIIGDSIYWNINSLLPFQTNDIDITFSVPIPPLVHSGEVVNFTSGILQFSNDTVPSDNYSSLSAILYGSYDPNYKFILGQDSIDVSSIPNGEYITYVIQFQNTGNYLAHNVVITDEISSLLEINSIEVISASHLYQMFKEDNLITWSFSNIQLADIGSNEPASHGFICFKIKISESVNISSIIYNRASIYFDYNPPVITDNSIFYITDFETSIVKNNITDSYMLYPNPAHETLQIVPKEGYLIKESLIFNSIGELILKSTSLGIDISLIPQGLYLLKIESKNTSVCIFKFIKE